MKHLPNIRGPQDLKKLSPEALCAVAAEIRETIIASISETGGHLASSLGAADLITALHYVYNSPADKIVFDTGHQAYAHKLLTGRLEGFKTVRRKNGLSGFLKRHESVHDAFGAGHASTALSAAAGMAASRDLSGSLHKIVAVVSDGCMTGGMAWEALQNIGQSGTDLLAVLNDNQMFISRRVGRLGRILTRLLTNGTVQNAERKAEVFLNRFQFWGKSILKVAKRTRVLLFPGMIFEEMGFTYFGPVDGHDIPELIEVLGYVKNMKGPVLLHVVTKKGKGYEPAEEEPTEFHGAPVFNIETGETKKAAATAPSFTKVFGQAMVRLAEKNPKICAITAAMPEGTGLDKFRDTFPGRYYDVGIAEEHALTFAAGLAADGLRPVAAIYSSFIQRAFDQIMHDICLQKLPVVVALDRAGLVGEDGPTHHGVFDLSLFRMLPDIVVMAPADENELQHMLSSAFSYNMPVVIRYPRGRGFGVEMDAEFKNYPLGKGRWLSKGGDINILAVGNRVHPALEAARLLKARGINAGVADMRFIKPLDLELLTEACGFGGRLVTVEDNSLAGGFGSAVLEAVNAAGLQARILRLGIPDNYVEQGKPDELYAELGLDANGIAAAVTSWLSRLGAGKE
ncbi:MAG: 1-deoxy-D-xylulose-5-phosphate synthase [Elusimicrobia bacterium GWC2_51_8]|nr:MAG: 1-deoxy-D-xylulose-5-phosphate synthase [Elusimicrobia bacterium GWA2_51_34]OGR57565.1 MAG: 1-deoxy-D-xylulose-5-phosphate synthase [Elusimicrobia bacterium GWC2_51_8]OGR84553.1 MAG: 1-deoxy-D-xylulose-5-phosphate synthase [Elusimicrobia bacterium GWF2_52_66]HAF95583.1 1-deoxy-D-xylulose-5-phosphate synthase [Elusimicrobiota bacterium]HCE98846.1 1-deoxy-D-xylulose-5-phosphate synthase [Elusimicrobiota bacterium]